MNFAAQRRQQLICITLMIYSSSWMVDSGLLHPSLPSVQVHYYNNNKNNGERTDQRTKALMTIDTLSKIDDAAVSFLFKIKIYPFRRPTPVNQSDKATARFGGPETGVVKRTVDSNGLVAVGVDLSLPGKMGGLGYGHQMPFQTYSFSSIFI